LCNLSIQASEKEETTRQTIELGIKASPKHFSMVDRAYTEL